MKRRTRYLPLLVIAGAVLLMLLHGPIPQPAHYHDFADVRTALGFPNAADVLSNIGFAAVGLWGWLRSRHAAHAMKSGWPGYGLFLTALVLTAAGSFYYHLQPDDVRLVWDRIPIALACAGLLAAVHGEMAGSAHTARNTLVLAVAGVSSVMWWRTTGDLRPYLLMQGLPLVLIPLWQWMQDTPRDERKAFGIAVLLYILAKVAELLDHDILALSDFISGHTLKHLLATIAASAIASVLVKRSSQIQQAQVAR